jgi:hypothetical protein
MIPTTPIPQTSFTARTITNTSNHGLCFKRQSNYNIGSAIRQQCPSGSEIAANLAVYNNNNNNNNHNSGANGIRDNCALVENTSDPFSSVASPPSPSVSALLMLNNHESRDREDNNEPVAATAPVSLSSIDPKSQTVIRELLAERVNQVEAEWFQQLQSQTNFAGIDAMYLAEYGNGDQRNWRWYRIALIAALDKHFKLIKTSEEKLKECGGISRTLHIQKGSIKFQETKLNELYNCLPKLFRNATVTGKEEQVVSPDFLTGLKHKVLTWMSRHSQEAVAETVPALDGAIQYMIGVTSRVPQTVDPMGSTTLLSRFRRRASAVLFPEAKHQCIITSNKSNNGNSNNNNTNSNAIMNTAYDNGNNHNSSSITTNDPEQRPQRRNNTMRPQLSRYVPASSDNAARNEEVLNLVELPLRSAKRRCDAMQHPAPFQTSTTTTAFDGGGNAVEATSSTSSNNRVDRPPANKRVRVQVLEVGGRQEPLLNPSAASDEDDANYGEKGHSGSFTSSNRMLHYQTLMLLQSQSDLLQQQSRLLQQHNENIRRLASAHNLAI